MTKKKEVGVKRPELNNLIEAINAYREGLYQSETVSKTKFQHMQTALHGAKNIIRTQFGVKAKSETAWVK